VNYPLIGGLVQLTESALEPQATAQHRWQHFWVAPISDLHRAGGARHRLLDALIGE